MLDRGPYPISLYPGQARLIQLLNPDGSVYAIPTGATSIGRAIDVLQSKIADLAVTITDAAKGMIRIELPDTSLVRESWQSRAYYDVQITLGTLTKYLPVSEIDILYSPSQRNPSANSQPGYTIAPIGNPSSVGTVTPAPAPTALYIQDQIWVDNQNKRVRVSIERQANGSEYFKLTEVV